jgi:hypothetical protein
MTRSRVNRVMAILPLVLSAAAFAIVMANIVAGVPPQADENASAHLWQWLMVAQFPLILLYLLTADWRSRSSAVILALQVLGIAMASVPVWLAGY